MFQGKIQRFEKLEYVCRSQGSGSAASNMYPCAIVHGASLASRYTHDYLSRVLGLSMSVLSSRWAVLGATQPTEDPTTEASLTFPAIATDATVSRSVFSSDCTAVLEMTDVVLYATHNGVWELRIGGVEWTLNGEVLGSWSGITETGTMPVTPCSIPIIPGYVEISAHSQIVLGTPTGIPLPMETECRWDSVGHLGFRYKQGGVWYSPPVVFTSPNPPAGNEIDVSGVLAGGTMYDGVVNVRGVYEEAYALNSTSGGSDYYDDYRFAEGVNVSGCLVPNLAKGIRRLNGDYGAVIFRGGFPQTTGQTTWNDYPNRVEVVNTDVVHPPMTQFLGTVRNASHVIEDPFSYPSYSLSTINGTALKDDVSAAYVVPAGTTAWSYTLGLPVNPSAVVNERYSHGLDYVFPATVSGGDPLSYLTHDDPVVTYLNTWCNPHWSYVLWFPPEDAPTSVQWKLDGAPVTAQEYWLQARAQHLTHPALPGEDDVKWRGDVVTEPLWQNGLSGLMSEVVFGQFTSWWGVSRFHADAPAIPANMTLDATSAPAWSVPEDSGIGLAVGSGGVTLTGPAKRTVTLDLGRFDSRPYMQPHTADRLAVPLPETNVSAAAAVLVGHEGSTVALEPVDTPQERPTGPSRKQVGTWGHDYGLGVVVDQGEDVPAFRGQSVAAMADNERVFAMTLLPGRGAARLRYTIDAADPDQPVTIPFPAFYSPPHSKRRVVYESGALAGQVSERGPAWRWGGWTWYVPGVGHTDPPIANASVEGASTVYDWLCFKRVALQGRAALDGFAAEVESLYDWGVELTQLSHLAADPFQDAPVTHAFLYRGPTKFVGCMVNSYSEVPPLAGWPSRTRDDDLQPAEGYDQVAYSLVATRKYLVTAGGDEDFAQLVHLPSTELLTRDDPCEGWVGGYHRMALTGSEAKADYRVRWLTKDRVKLRPWHGYLWIPGDLKVVPGVHLTRGPTGLLLQVRTTDEGVRLRRFDFQAADATFVVRESEGAIASAQVARTPSGAVVVVYDEEEDDGWTVRRTISTNQGETWEEPVAVGPGRTPAIAVQPRSGLEYVARWQDGAWRLWRRRTPDADPEDVGEITSFGEDGRPGLEVAGGSGAELVFVADDGEETRRYISTNQGETWEEG
jgi:hypothetical protein